MRKLPTSWIISAALLVLVLFLFYRFGKEFSGMFSNWFGQEENERPADEYPDTPVDPEEVSPGFDPMPYVIRLQEVLRNWFWDSSARCDVYERLMGLTNGDFITVCNAYKQTTGRTLRSDMDATLYDGCNVFYNRYGVQVRNRMDDLEIYG